MNATKLNQICQSKYWWSIMLVGVLMIVCGMAYWILPAQGYVVASQLFGWLLVGVGVVQFIISTGKNRPKGWGWWLVGGILDIFVGFLLIQNVGLSEMLLPYFLAVIFIYWGVTALIDAVTAYKYKFWWIKLLNGILLIFIGFFFISAGYMQDIIMISTLVSLAFIYWGITLVSSSFELKPIKTDQDTECSDNC